MQEMRTSVTGKVRLTMTPIAFETAVRSALRSFYESYPDVSVEISINEGLRDIVAQGFDGGIRFGTLVEKDMVAIPLIKSNPVAIAGSSAYFEARSVPTTPEDLADHRCVYYRFMTSARLFPWPPVKGDNKVEFKGDGALVFDDGAAIRSAVIDGLGLGFLFRSQVAADLEAGHIIEVLTDWLTGFPGFSLYYPGRRTTSSAFRAMAGHLRHEKTQTDAFCDNGIGQRVPVGSLPERS